jgi:hypothetical protein
MCAQRPAVGHFGKEQGELARPQYFNILNIALAAV